jgi:iron(III) transport system substrate-binding protein
MPEPNRSSYGSVLVRLLGAGLLVAVLVAAYRYLWQGGRQPLVVYCAHDSVYSEGVLRAFERQTGIPVAVKFDTEATKSLGLAELLIREKSRPRCDVFWNNELLGTLDLQEKGVLLPYRGSGFERIPSQFKDPQGFWAGFGARLRVYVINTERLQPSEEAVRQVLSGDLSRVAIAKPLFGTTLTHYSVLWSLWGEAKLKAWHSELRQRGLREVMGNAQVRNLVAEGVCDLGFTDSDDYFVVKDEGKPVAALPVRLEDGSVICIPNTAAIINGTSRLAQAQQLVDYLLSEPCEVALARSRARQIPLGPVDEGDLPEEVRALKDWAKAGVPLTELGPARTACLNWLKGE